LKNPAAVNDDFWSCFLFLWIHAFSFVFNFVKFTLEERKPIAYYTCASLMPDNFASLPRRIQASTI
jgi:hypothetical protein